MLEAVGFALEQHHGGSPPAGDVQGLVRGVENQDLAHGRSATGSAADPSHARGSVEAQLQPCLLLADA